MLLTFVTVVHFTVALLLIVMVLIQDSKGGGVFGMGSTGSNQVFSATGAANFLVTATRGLAITFAVTCLTLTYITSHKAGTDSVVDDYVPAAATSAPASPDSETTLPETAPTEEAPAQSENK
ncbi:MAG: preprotein translocase subunit SecG [Bdellovibrionales bacterium]|nr:preprotein translocase subunit SecG [Bdellovibrionales bacterium]